MPVLRRMIAAGLLLALGLAATALSDTRKNDHSRDEAVVPAWGDGLNAVWRSFQALSFAIWRPTPPIWLQDQIDHRQRGTVPSRGAPALHPSH